VSIVLLRFLSNGFRFLNHNLWQRLGWFTYLTACPIADTGVVCLTWTLLSNAVHVEQADLSRVGLYRPPYSTKSLVKE
jgi:hypothetical protein